MSSHPVSSNLRNSAARPAKKSSFKARCLSFARDMWHSYQRHSQYQVMLAAGRQYGAPEKVIYNRSKSHQG
ncbi:hypothetical protein [Paraburkholderia sp. BL10I2N1]|uniref:hypothetical protein n=1 Tax=Paraburkholderia sp. BL10I2N1 TaxID=1938796 RepID=UPI00105F1B45|nr:hypothetical protein [Paraburkholderia sp. BL10I2N1]TDN63569.1 hypothetical protein B0G77_7245 [Paraburkholderia sp. BL10I2N1]